MLARQVYSLQLDSWKWTEHTSEVEGEAPAPRSGHTAVALPDGRHLALFGGGDSDKDLFYANVAILDTLTWRWSTPKLQVHILSDPQRLRECCPFVQKGSYAEALLLSSGTPCRRGKSCSLSSSSRPHCDTEHCMLRMGPVQS